MTGIAESWRIFITHVQPRRLLKEDPGVKGPLWFGREPDNPLHVPANLLRLFFAIFMSPLYLLITHTKRSVDHVLKRSLWGIEWAKTPDAVLLESPGSLNPEEGKVPVVSRGKYQVTGNRPRWILKVTFRGTKVAFQKQERYEWERRQKGRNAVGSETARLSPEAQALQDEIEEKGYTAISYAMDSAEEIFFKAGGELDPQPEIKPGGKRKYSLPNRQKISQVVLNEYARARRKIHGAEDNTEFIWLDEFCLSNPAVRDEKEVKRQRDVELGNLADIFRGAKRVVVFCHVEDCIHTDSDCVWGNRLFTMGEILYAPEVLRMTRSKDSESHRLESRITAVSGQRFRADMQACAEEAERWHLYNIMQHATNSGGVTWQSAIHSLVVEAIRRDEAGDFHEHNLLGKALNGLLPRRSHLHDLRGENGWADLAWLLELNQGYYNAALLAAVCKLADPQVEEYRWWGKPIAPKEGSERLEAFATAIPAMFRRADNHAPEPVLSIIGPRCATISHLLQRDAAGLHNNDEMKSLKRWATWTCVIFAIVGFFIFVSAADGSAFNDKLGAGLSIMWLASLAFVILELLVGTMFVERDTWFVVEDHVTGRDALSWLRSQDATFDQASEWGPRQLIPKWDTPLSRGPSPPGSPPLPYGVTLIDLRTGIFTKAAVTSRPNDMVILAAHGSGITCMLLDRDEKAIAATVAVKVGMVNLPPFVLAQAELSGTVYVGGRPYRGRHLRSPRTIRGPQPAPSSNPNISTTNGSYDPEKLCQSSNSLNVLGSRYNT